MFVLLKKGKVEKKMCLDLNLGIRGYDDQVALSTY